MYVIYFIWVAFENIGCAHGDEQLRPVEGDFVLSSFALMCISVCRPLQLLLDLVDLECMSVPLGFWYFSMGHAWFLGSGTWSDNVEPFAFYHYSNSVRLPPSLPPRFLPDLISSSV